MLPVRFRQTPSQREILRGVNGADLGAEYATGCAWTVGAVVALAIVIVMVLR